MVKSEYENKVVTMVCMVHIKCDDKVRCTMRKKTQHKNNTDTKSPLP